MNKNGLRDIQKTLYPLNGELFKCYTMFLKTKFVLSTKKTF